MVRYLVILLLLLPFAAPANVKVGGVEFVPKDLIFASAESRSQAAAEGTLPNDCQWKFQSVTRIGRREDAQRCVRFYFKTTVTLVQTCPAKSSPEKQLLAERITATDTRCPDSAGRLNVPSDEAAAISSGITADGKRQDIIRQPDGTRITISHDAKTVAVRAAFPDGTADVLQLP